MSRAVACKVRLRILLLVLVGMVSHPSCVRAFAGVSSAGEGGKLSCEVDGGVCYTQSACCEDYSCVRVSHGSYGRCTPNRADMRLASSDVAGARGPSKCATDADCSAGQCCRPDGLESLTVAVETRRSFCRDASHCGGGGGGGGSGSGQDSMESLFNQYYSALMRKRMIGN